MDAEFLTLMPHTISVAPPDGTYTRGKPDVGTAVEYVCYIEPTSGEHVVRGADGEERQAKYVIYVSSTSEIDPTGTLTLPAGYDPQSPPILSSKLVSDENGPHHVELMV